jgi:hypothetical protein
MMRAIAFAVQGDLRLQRLLGGSFRSSRWDRAGLLRGRGDAVRVQHGLGADAGPLSLAQRHDVHGDRGLHADEDGHVRVDIFYREARHRTKAVVDLIGCLFFVAPFCGSWSRRATPTSRAPGVCARAAPTSVGCPALYVLKSFVLVFVAAVGLQAVAMALRSVLVLRGREDLVPQAFRYPAAEA